MANTYIPTMDYNEPENYQQTRENMVVLMQALKKVNDGLKALGDNPLLSEFFGDRITGSTKNMSKAINMLGEMYGFTVTDDVIENRLKQV